MPILRTFCTALLSLAPTCKCGSRVASCIGVVSFPVISLSVCRCCNFATFESNGTFSSGNVSKQLQEMAVITSTKRDVWLVIGVSQEAVYSGSWTKGLDAAAATAQQMLSADALLRGWIVDYEPSTNYSMAHAQAYGEFLGGLVKALRPVGLALAMVSGEKRLASTSPCHCLHHLSRTRPSFILRTSRAGGSSGNSTGLHSHTAASLASRP